MRIGLLRHFEVDCSHTYMLSGGEFQEWVRQYDSSPIKVTAMPETKYNWEKCYCSDLPRAIKTAQHVYQGIVIKTALIREVPIAPVFILRMDLPHIFWLIAGRIAWWLSHSSQPETVKQTRDRVRRFVSELMLEPEKSILVVTHGFLMPLIQKELNNNGFIGERSRRAKCGRIYVFENN